MKPFRVLAILFLALDTAPWALAEDWPTYMHDAQRSGITSDSLATNLVAAWIYPRVAKPTAAWSDEARSDYYNGPTKTLRNRLEFDCANQIASSDGRVYLGSSTEDTVSCLDAITGELKWTFFADAPVRMAPTVNAGKVYFGADDGWAYCLDAISGERIWKYSLAGTNHYLVPNNGRFVSPWAVRSGVVVDAGVAYFAGGIFPGFGGHICAVDALTGARNSSRHWHITQTNRGNASLQGYALLSGTRLYLPGGRCNPLYFNRANGAYQGQYDRQNAFGTFALLSGTNLFMGPAKGGGGNGGGAAITQAGEAGGGVIATFANGNAILVTATNSYLLSDTALTALKRSNRATIWSKSVKCPYALILAGTTLLAGGDNQVAAFDSASGNPLWSLKVDGRAYGLAVGNRVLFVSTDQGFVHAFVSNPGGRQDSIKVF